jgi:hypothetical protein
VEFTDGDWNGDAPDSRQIGYSNSNVSSTVAQVIVSSDGSTNITGLFPKTLYYFWARVHNSYGWSDWSGRGSVTTHGVPDAPSAPVLTDVTQVSVAVSGTPNYNGGSPLTGYDIGYQEAPPLGDTTTPIAPETIVPTTGISGWVIYDLTPNTKYNFWIRAKNSIGTGPWSERSSVYTIAGARVCVAGVWVNAVPYVRVSGVWKVARPWVKVDGIWQESM